jgi:hypothetical protein
VLDVAATDALALAFAWFDALEFDVSKETPANSWVRRHRTPCAAWLRNFATTHGARQAARFLAALRRLDHPQRAAIVAALRRSD